MLEIGKIPPQAVDLEEAILGAMMTDSKCIIRVRSTLKPEMFYKDKNQKICTAIYSLNDENNPVDILTVTNKLRSLGTLSDVGGAFVVSSLIDGIVSSANVEYHAAIVYQKYIGRETIAVCSDAIKKAFEDTEDPFDVKNELAVKISKLDANLGNSSVTIGDIDSEFLEHQIKIANGEMIPSLTGIDGFDKLNGGLGKSDLVIIAGTTSNGKTAIALNIATEVSKTNSVKFYSFEQSSLQLYMRQLSMLSGNNSRDLNKGDIYDSHSLGIAREELKKRKIVFSEKHNHINDIVNDITNEKLKNNVEVFFIDYLQLMTSNHKELRISIGIICTRLKLLAKELNVSIVLLSQMSRGLDSKSKPALNRLKDSGSIEEAADTVILTWLPSAEPTSLQQVDFKGEILNTTEVVDGKLFKLAILTQAKGRNIGTGMFYGYLGENLKFYNKLPIFVNTQNVNNRIEPSGSFDDSTPF